MLVLLRTQVPLKNSNEQETEIELERYAGANALDARRRNPKRRKFLIALILDVFSHNFFLNYISIYASPSVRMPIISTISGIIGED